MTTIKIPKPEFAQYESAWTDWNCEPRKVQITSRWYNFDKQDWWYELKGEDGKHYPECAFYRKKG